MRTSAKGISDAFELANRKWDEGQFREAFRLLLRAVESRVSYAFNSLGYFYDNGIGTRANKRLALYWYRRGARTGDVCAYVNLAICYRAQGKRSLAKKWFKRALERGDGDATLELAKMYLGSRQAAQQKEGVKILRSALLSKSITQDSRNQAVRLLRSRK